MRKTGTRLLAVLLAVVMVLPSVLIPGMAAEATGFTDVPEGSWYADAVNYVSEKGYMAGVGDNKFAPNDEVTRAMFVTILARITMAETDGTVSAFTDVPANKWYTGAVSWAAENGIVNGVGDRMFAPGKSITRQDLCTILYRFVNAMDYELTVGEEKTFTDSASVSSYAAEAVRYASSVGLIAGYDDGTFRPKATATRAQMAVIIMRLARLLDGQIVKPEPMPAQSFNGAAGDDMTVSVNAPKGALPESTSMTTTRVTDNAVLATMSVRAGAEIYAAADISFTKDGTEIEPSAAVEVQIAMDGLEALQNPTIVHLRDDGTVEPVNGVELVSVTRGGKKALRFYASDFSIYAVVDENTGDSARATVNFHRTTGEVVTFYVKNDDSLAEIEKIIFDPGSGAVEDGKLFAGWSLGAEYDENTPHRTVQQIREFLVGEQITEGDTFDFYPILMTVWTATYFGTDERVSLGADAILVIAKTDHSETAEYTVSQPFGTDAEHHFEGWHVKEGASNIVKINGEAAGAIDANTLFPNGTTITVKGSVQFSVYAPAGHWLVFNENGKGAKYNVPRFLETNEVTAKPCPDEEMIRNGYNFGGWYKDADCTEVFTFGSTITKKTNVYAKWTPKEDAPYTVVIWKQNINGNGYDFERSIPLTGVTGETINVITTDGSAVVDVDENGDSRTTNNIKVDGEEISFSGFHFSDYNKNVKIAPEGNTVLNVYYDRNNIQFNYKLLVDAGGIIIYPGTPNFDDGGTYYCADPDDGENSTSVYQVYKNTNGEYVYNYSLKEIIASIDDLEYSSGVNDSYNTSSYYVIYNNKTYRIWYSSSYRNWVAGTSSTVEYYASAFFENGYTVYRSLGTTETRPAHAPYYYATTSQGMYTVLTVTGLYEASLETANWTWPNSYWWYDSYTTSTDWYSGSTTYSGSGPRAMFLDEFKPTGDSAIVDFYGFAPPSSATHTVHFMKQNIDGTYSEANSPSASAGSNGYITFLLSDKYTGYKCVSWSTDGTTYTNVGNKMRIAIQNGQYVEVSEGGNWYYDAGSASGFQPATSTGDIYIRFDRLKYKINYSDGIYVDGNGNVIDEDPISQGFGESDYIVFGDNISAYGDKNDTTHYKVPTREGYAFEGWYADDVCSTPYKFTTMPQNNVTVYAKWRQVQYRVYLHPNVPSTDESLDWGDDDKPEDQKQSMCFRISYGGKASAPEGLRDDFWMNGWFLDEACTKIFNADAYVLNEHTVTTAYDRETEFTDVYNKWGELEESGKEHADSAEKNNRFWITKKLDLYASWRAKLNGADGIGVAYDLNGGSGTVKDSMLYQDNSTAIAQNAPTGAPSGDLQFLYWELQTWNGTAYVSAGKAPIYPGGAYKVLVSDAKQVARMNEDNTPMVDGSGKPLYTYTVQLKAIYGPKEVEQKTHIIWYGNGGTLDGTTTGTEYVLTADAQINAKFEIQPDLFTHPAGYVFLGWVRLPESQVVNFNEDHSIKDFNLQEVAEESVWLKFNAADGDQHPENYFTVQNDADTNINGTVVTHIAADEREPYQVLVAVWSTTPYYYVFHSSNCEIEARPLVAGETVDLTKLVKRGYLYGGYYKNYQNLDDTEVFNASFKAVYAANQTATVSSAVPYNGSALKEGEARFWTRANAYKQAEGADPGSALHPQGSEVYFLKEVPNDYLPSRLVTVRYTGEHNGEDQGDEPFSDLFLLTAVDDTLYSDVGFLYGTAKDPDKFESYTTFSNAFNVVYKDENDNLQQTSYDAKALNSNLKRGYVAAYRVDVSSVTGENKAAFILPAWTTLDGCTISQNQVKFYVNNDNQIVWDTNP